MNFLGVVTTEGVRGVLGVEAEELPDTVFTDTTFEIELQVEIESWLPELISVACAAAQAGSASSVQRHNLLKVYAQYAGAIVISPHINFGISQETTDGQNAYKRREKALEGLLKVANDRVERYKTLILEAYDQTPAAGTQFFGSASPSYDPVTDEES